ncbi:MAG: ABC transporter ATP-binding protein [Opitutus sp.]|nr:ABC transporter ATP-binding protein [Opitutus sp.]
MSGAPSLSPLAEVPAIELRAVVKDFAVGLRGLKLRAVAGLSLRVAPGQVYGLLGPNGSGKSTTIKIILGLLSPTAGTCMVFGQPSGRVAARLDVGYLPESPYFYRHLTGRELVRFYARICGLGGPALAARVAEVIAWVGLEGAADRRVGTYSKGMQQRIGLAQALVHDPRLVILDEPTAGIDPIGSAAMAELILKLKAQGKTVLITSHLLAQIEDVCDRIAILDGGRLLLEGAVRDLVGCGDRQTLVVGKLSTGELADLRAWLTARGRTLESVESPRVRLDQIFRERVGRGGVAEREDRG